MEGIAETLCCSAGSISLDLRRWRAERFEGLAPKPRGGSESKVSEEQFAALEAALEAPPSEVGYCAGTWTLPLMVRFLVEQVGAPKLHIGNVSRRLGGATPSMIYAGASWQKPGRSAKTLRHPIRLRHFREQRITVYELAA